MMGWFWLKTNESVGTLLGVFEEIHKAVFFVVSIEIPSEMSVFHELSLADQFARTIGGMIGTSDEKEHRGYWDCCMVFFSLNDSW